MISILIPSPPPFDLLKLRAFLIVMVITDGPILPSSFTLLPRLLKVNQPDVLFSSHVDRVRDALTRKKTVLCGKSSQAADPPPPLVWARPVLQKKIMVYLSF